MFNVDKKTISLIVNPEMKEKMSQKNKEVWKDYKISREAHAKAIAKLRKYKKELYAQGKLIVQDDNKKGWNSMKHYSIGKQKHGLLTRYIVVDLNTYKVFKFVTYKQALHFVNT